MIRLALFIALMCSGLYWLSSLTALPDVKPLDTSELPGLLKEMKETRGAIDTKNAKPASPTPLSGVSLRGALEGAIRRIEQDRRHSFAGLGAGLGLGLRPGASALADRLSTLPIDGLSAELTEAVRSPDPDLVRIAELVLRDTEALPRERLIERADERARLLKLSLEATREKNPALEQSAPTWVNVGLRSLEVPTEPDARDPAQAEMVQDAARLVRRFTPEPGKRALLYQKLEPIHPSPILQGELQQILQGSAEPTATGSK